ncbi:Rad52/Rad22 family DNA repair protein [Nostoc sp. TCL240-02]|uniref:Rad52/Rad22 family DNA repair protein n=1 Tax=Nostoc sp. TCL240-02 TaxID=2572090 RepID=UPI00157FAD84|nr:Rad52/Rad22 family DNA repair protein [Nostoc sp. TCL240-02]
MITPEIRNELRRIQSELKKPFPASLHEFRELPGGKKWVFLKWQTIRERLDEVTPEWISDYSEIQYLGNDAICRCGITILGVRKEAIASVPISITSSGGKEMSRGSAADRLAAEALKNTAEAWGVGRYLDDQVFTIRYLWERMSELDDGACGEVRRLSEQYKIQVKTAQLRNAPPGSIPVDTFARSPKKSPSDIFEPPKKSVILTPSSLDRNLLNAEIESVLKRKNISIEQAKNVLSELFNGVRSRQRLSDKQLSEFLEYLKSPKETAV